MSLSLLGERNTIHCGHKSHYIYSQFPSQIEAITTTKCAYKRSSQERLCQNYNNICDLNFWEMTPVCLRALNDILIIFREIRCM